MKNKLRSCWPVTKNIILKLEQEADKEDFLISRFASTLSTSLVRIWTSGIVHEPRSVKRSGWSDSEIDDFFGKHFRQSIDLFNRVCEYLAIFYQMRYGQSFRIFTVLTNCAAYPIVLYTMFIFLFTYLNFAYQQNCGYSNRINEMHTDLKIACVQYYTLKL